MSAERFREEATIGGRDFTSHALVVQLSKQACWIIHGSYPLGYTCLDVAQHAADYPECYSSAYGNRLANHEELCWPCAAKASLSREHF